MRKEGSIHPFVRRLAAVRLADCFNPYGERCPVYDLADAPERRSRLLSAVLQEAELRGVDSMWIGRDLGHRGGRRTGLALTDDAHVQTHARRWGLKADGATIGDRVCERTATVIWSVLDGIDEAVFLWNVFPFHPYQVGMPFTNRPHSLHERRIGEGLLVDLVKQLSPSRIVPIGNDAAAAVRRLGLSTPVVAVRHPSYGGERQFVSQMVALYDS